MCIRDRDDDLDWEEEVLGEMEGGEPNDRFANYWNDDTGMTSVSYTHLWNYIMLLLTALWSGKTA